MAANSAMVIGESLAWVVTVTGICAKAAEGIAIPTAMNQDGKGFLIFATPKVGGERRIVLFRSVGLFRNRARHAERSWGD
ncbi:hypothetical protein D3C84_1109030 [compost metagenome]